MTCWWILVDGQIGLLCAPKIQFLIYQDSEKNFGIFPYISKYLFMYQKSAVGISLFFKRLQKISNRSEMTALQSWLVLYGTPGRSWRFKIKRQNSDTLQKYKRGSIYNVLNAARKLQKIWLWKVNTNIKILNVVSQPSGPKRWFRRHRCIRKWKSRDAFLTSQPIHVSWSI